MLARHAMLLAAGLGIRMRPLTTDTARPLLPLGGRRLLGHAPDPLSESGVEHVAVTACGIISARRQALAEAQLNLHARTVGETR